MNFYKVLVESDETGGFIVTCPAFSGCYSQGDTVENALDNLEEAILLCTDEQDAV